MLTLSHWAKLHPWSSRFAIVAIKLLLFYLAWNLGTQLEALNIVMSDAYGYSALLVFLALVFIYPSKNSWKNYTFRKCCDLSIALTSFLLVMVISNNGFVVRDNIMASQSPSSITKHEPAAASNLASLTKQEKRNLRKEFKTQVKEYVKKKVKRDKATAGQVALIILTIIVAIALTGVVAALACSVACNGAEVIAIFIILAGIVGIIAGASALIKRIRRGKKKPQDSGSPEPDNSSSSGSNEYNTSRI